MSVTSAEPTPGVQQSDRGVTGSSLQVRLRILVVDDNHEFRCIIKELLEQHGHLVMTASSGAKGLEVFTAKKDEIDVVLLDYFMPAMDGAQTFEWLRKIKPTVKVLIVSGAEELRLRQIHARHAIDGYIRKPLLVEEVLHVIRKVMMKPTRPNA
jgi:two-component system cell cycle sensor histidine kinase/response regulator CckA